MMSSKLGVYYTDSSMADDHDVSRRLRRLEACFSAKPAQGDAAATSVDVAAWHMRSVTLDRIAYLTMELQRRGDAVIDAVDALEMRLLLTDYTASTTHLRAVTRIAKQGIASASSHLRNVRRTVERELHRPDGDGRSSGGDS
jgi:hypothetical protein